MADKDGPQPTDLPQPYKDPVESLPLEERLPLSQMPKAPDPMPFKIGPMSPGGRE